MSTPKQQNSKRPKSPIQGKETIVKRVNGRELKFKNLEVHTIVRVEGKYSIISLEVDQNKVTAGWISEPDHYPICIAKMGSRIYKRLFKEGK
jgi:hypothetical protein